MRLLFKLTLFFSILIIIVSCNTDNDGSSQIDENKSVSKQDDLRAQELITSKCIVCHSHKVPKDQLLAPPMAAIQNVYKNTTSSQKEFIERFVDFVSAPTKEKATMKKAVDKFGLMADEGTKKEDLVKIASYLYNNEVEKPEWWGKAKRIRKEDSPETVGENYAMSAQKALSLQLKKAIKKGGPAYAVDFCNVNAMPITDSVSNHFNAVIKRLSDRPRNPMNKANEEESRIIQDYKKSLASNGELDPTIIKGKDSTRFYLPIQTNAICLKCHGQPNSQIDQTTLAKLNELYPNDKAIGYNTNEIRGIWSIIFKNIEE